ncbi:MAG TPA: ABC transporter substrate-binding protein [Actinomycetota bacterium]|nr:ABC transporter substrate-binding protein [Actinomycetota bacterium]
MRRTIALALTLAALGAAALAPVARAQSSAPEEPVVLTVGTLADLTTDNIWGINSGSDWTVATTQFDMLLRFDDVDASAAPSLATGCEPDEDYMTWTCTLQEGLRWSDGEPLTSEDVAFTYRFIIDHKIPQFRGYFPFDPVFETPDDTTLIWKASAPTFAPDMPPWVYIVPEHIWGPYADLESMKDIKSVDAPQIGSGPFTLTEWERGASFTFDRNPEFWGQEPTVDRIVYRVFTNEGTMVQSLKNGEIDFADGLSSTLFDSLRGQPSIATHATASDWWLNLAFNFGGQSPDAHPLPALHDLRVRQAILMAIDKQEIADKVYVGTAQPGDTVIRPASTYWHLDIPSGEEVAYDPAAANALLDEAGYEDTDGNGVREDPSTGDPLHLDMPASSDTTGAVEAGQFIVGYLDAIGIDVDLKAAEDGLMNEVWGSGDFDAYIWYWSGDPDPNYQLSIFASDQCGGWSDGCWQDTSYDQLYEEQRGIMDRAERLAVVQEAQRYIYDQVPVIPLAYPGWLQAYRTDRFENWQPSPGEKGYLLPSYNYQSLLKIRPVANSTGATTSGLPGWIWAVGLGVVALVALALVFRGRRRAAEEA